MTKAEFLKELGRALEQNQVADAAEILGEYGQHFAFKTADGHSEEEIAAKLGDPGAIALLYAAQEPGEESLTPKRMGILRALALGGLWLPAAPLFAALWIFSLGLGVFVGLSAAMGFNLALGLDLTPMLYLPPVCAAIFGAGFLALAVLSAAGLAFYIGFLRALTKAFRRLCKKLAAPGEPSAPYGGLTPRLSHRTRRRLRKIVVISLCVFALCLVVGYAACTVAAGAWEFWHAWGWFGYLR